MKASTQMNAYKALNEVFKFQAWTVLGGAELEKNAMDFFFLMLHDPVYQPFSLQVIYYFLQIKIHPRA